MVYAMIFDFHAHTVLSDGILSPIELIRYAVVNDYAVIGVTDHAGPGSMGRIIAEVSRDCGLANKYWAIKAVPGIELTHLPPAAIDDVAREAKERGAKIVVVHGETLTEPVQKGTNTAALSSEYVDILAHPGRLTAEEALLAVRNNVFIELSGRRGHDAANAAVAAVALGAGARLLINSDAHSDEDLLTSGVLKKIVAEAGLTEWQAKQVLVENPQALLKKIGMV
ncbi:MAG: histidinol phosphate phosphatase domain-containing protein [Dehalococcoidia bacterium]|nr:histidinol phosphate phosphatase domain-containing protein [Dehalococcoidia bacterium]